MVRKVVITLLVFACSSLASYAAIDSFWVVQLRASYNYIGQGTILLGTRVGASDSFTMTGAQDALLMPQVSGYGEIGSTIGSVTRISKDYRAPLTYGEVKVWHLSMLINAVTTPATIVLKGWVPSAAKIDGNDTIVSLYQGTNKLFTFAPGSSGTSTAPNYTASFTYDGLNPIPLELVASTMPVVVVPEPSSLVILALGAAGTAFARRPRRRA